MNSDELIDRTLIRELIENWALWRDSGDWASFATVWHPDGVMVATWQQSRADAFIVACRAGWENGVKVSHTLGGSSVTVAGDRAIAQTRMTISQRAEVHGVVADVTCTGRFYDFLIRRGSVWSMLLRQPIYERDRMDAVKSKSELVLDEVLLDRFPEGYRHLAYLQTQQGFTVREDMPGTRGPEVEALYDRGRAWLRDGVSPID